MKQLIALLALVSALSCFAETRMYGASDEDSLYCFRFVRERGMLYVSYKGNGETLERLLALVRRHREDILSGNVPVFVEGLCPDAGLAREHSNRVKSEMIVRGGLRETCFRTVNHVSEEDYVEVRLAVAASGDMASNGAASENVSFFENVSSDNVLSGGSQSQTSSGAPDGLGFGSGTGTDADTAASAGDASAENISAGRVSSSGNPERCGFSLPLSVRTNLLRLATLTADLGVEYRRADAHLGILVNGTFANWGWKDRQRRYKVWTVSPELRCYLGDNRRGFLGVMYHLGEFNYKLGTTGKKGDYQGGGITGGYRLPLHRRFAVDFHAAAGYIRAEYDEYTRTGNANVRRNKHGKLVKNYWGINRLGISLLYDL